MEVNKNACQCSIVLDLLPGYIDGVVSQDSKDFIEHHLTECDKCSKHYNIINNPEPIPIKKDDIQSYVNKSRRIKAMKIALISIVLVCISIFALFANQITITQNIVRRYEGIYLSSGNAEKTTVLIKGIVNFRPFGDSYTDVSYNIPGITDIISEEDEFLSGVKLSGDLSSPSFVAYQKADSGQIILCGYIVSTGCFKDFLIVVTDGQGKATGIICSSAENEKAIRIAEKFIKTASDTGRYSYLVGIVQSIINTNT